VPVGKINDLQLESHETRVTEVVLCPFCAVAVNVKIPRNTKGLCRM
jgi:hypothetical protein